MFGSGFPVVAQDQMIVSPSSFVAFKGLRAISGRSAKHQQQLKTYLSINITQPICCAEKKNILDEVPCIRVIYRASYILKMIEIDRYTY